MASDKIIRLEDLRNTEGQGGVFSKIEQQNESSSFYNQRREELGMSPVTSKETAIAMYKKIMKEELGIPNPNSEIGIALKKYLNESGIEYPTQDKIQKNFSKYLSGADIILADKNKDEVVSEDEFVVFKQLQKQDQLNAEMAKNNREITFDPTVIIAISIVCFSAIVVALILRLKKSSP